MAAEKIKKVIGKPENGIELTVITDEKFRTNKVVFHFLVPHNEKTASDYAAIAFLLEDTNADYPTITEFNRKMKNLYAGNISTGVTKSGNSGIIKFSGSCIADRYALENESITSDMIRMLMKCIFSPVTENGSFPVKQTEIKKNEMLDDIDAEINDKRDYIIHKSDMVIFENEPMSIPTKGTRETAEKVTADSIYRAWKRLLESARVEIVFSGNSFSDEYTAVIEEGFSALERKDIHVHAPVISAVKSEERRITETLDIAQSKMVLAWKFGEYQDYFKEVLDVFITAFGGSPFSMLFTNVREKMSLCYYCAAHGAFLSRTVTVDCGIEKENIEKAENAIREQLELMKKGEFSEELIEQSKLYICSSLKAVPDSPRGLISWEISHLLAGNNDSVEQYTDKINRVTKEDVVKAANALIPDTLYVLTGDAEEEEGEE